GAPRPRRGLGRPARVRAGPHPPARPGQEGPMTATSLLLPLCLAVAARGAGTDAAEPASVVVTAASDARFPEIAVEFEVRRPDGSFVLDAARDEFQVTEDGVAHPIVGFEAPVSRENRPTTVVLVVDRSGSMKLEDRIGGLKRAVASFLKGLPDGSRV